MFSASLSFTAEPWDVTHEGSSTKSRAKLPIAGDAEGCGAFRIIENTAELIRVEFTHCNPGTNTRGTMSFAIPRADSSLDESSDPRFYPTAVLEDLEQQRTLAYPTVGTLRADWSVLSGGAFTGVYELELVKYEFGGGGRASANLEFSIVAPVP